MPTDNSGWDVGRSWNRRRGSQRRGRRHYGRLIFPPNYIFSPENLFFKLTDFKMAAKRARREFAGAKMATLLDKVIWLTIIYFLSSMLKWKKFLEFWFFLILSFISLTYLGLNCPLFIFNFFRENIFIIQYSELYSAWVHCTVLYCTVSLHTSCL